MSPPSARGDALELLAGGLRVAAKVWGPESGRRVLALHGWLDNAASFDRLAPLLPEVRLVAIDLPGHGLSQHKPGRPFHHVLDWVADVIAIADALSWQQFALLGHSLGAAIASCVPSVVPERVERLALLDSLGPPSGPPAETPERARTAFVVRQAVLGKPARIYESEEAAAAALTQAIGRIGDTGVRLLLERGTRRDEGGLTFRADPSLRVPSPVRLVEEQVLAFLQAIRCPTLLVRASEAHHVDEAQLHARCAAVEGLQIAQVRGGHHAHLDEPEAVAAVLAPFFR